MVLQHYISEITYFIVTIQSYTFFLYGIKKLNDLLQII